MQRPQLVLVTGAFGNLGRSVVAKLVREGQRVRAFDLPTPANQKAAKALPAGVEACLGDVTKDEDVARAVSGVDAIVHLAAILPPVCERKPAAARVVNIEGTRRMIAAAMREKPDMPFVFSSSYTVYGTNDGTTKLVKTDTPTVATDTYTETKVAAEAMLLESTLNWVIFRVGAAIEGSASATDPIVIRLMFEIDPNSPIELVHGEDVATAMARAVITEGAYRKMLNLGGGPSCQLRQRDLLTATFEVIGVRNLPDNAFGTAPYYTCWLDTEESQRLLRFQEHDFAAIRADLEKRYAALRPFRAVVGPLIKFGLLRFSGPYQGQPSRPTWQALMDAGY